MNHGGFVLLFSKTLRSSIWMEPTPTRIVWFTMMMLKDKDGFVSGGSVEVLAHTARVTLQECQTALDTFLAPDKGSTTPDDEGRRIRKVDGGWLLVNHEQYRYSTEAKREFWRQQKAEQRRREEEAKKKRQAIKSKKTGPLNGEVETIRKVEDGELTPDQADAWAAVTREHV